ncbi:obstructor-J [Cochliomyia hominivorax]
MKILQKVCVIFMILTLCQIAKGEEDIENLKQKNICKSQPNGAMLPHPDNCHKFYICIKQKPFEYNCDPEYHYDLVNRKCVKGSSCSSNSNKPVTCSNGSVRPVQNDCYIFEACVEGQYQTINCPPNYYFNAKQLHCVPFTYDAEFQCNCLMPEHTVFENQNNCETYYVCREKSAVLENCPQDQYYNAQINACLVDLDGVCLMKPTMPPAEDLSDIDELSKVQNTADQETINACIHLGAEGIHFELFPRVCNSFYICVNGQLYIQYCPHGFVYNHEKKYCAIDASKNCLDTEDFVKGKLQSE